jgi:hypothetical protein
MTMQNAMVASTKKQAEAMIALLNAKLIRPSEGVERSHCDWVLGVLVPNLCLTVTTVPPHWRIPQQHVD